MFELLRRFMEDLLLKIFRPKRQASRIAILDEDNKENQNMNVPVNKKRVLTARAVLDNGSPAKFQAGSVNEWTVSPEGGLLLFPAADGLTCDAAWAAAGSQTVTCKGKNEAGADIVGTVDLVTDAAEIPPAAPVASRIQIDVGPVEDL